MGAYNTVALIEQLKSEVREVLTRVQEIEKENTSQLLNTPPEQGKWSIAQVVEHLNTYNRYYLPCVTQALAAAGGRTETFKPGWLGQYFTKAMYSEVKTKKYVANKMSAMKGHIPNTNLNAKDVIAEFVKAEKELLEMLENAKSPDIGGVRVPITISKWIKIKAGDALRFLVAHQVRHMLQINNTLALIRK